MGGTIKQYKWTFYLTFTASVFNCAIFLCCYKNMYSETLVDIAFIFNILLINRMYNYKQQNDYVENLFEQAQITRKHLNNE